MLNIGYILDRKYEVLSILGQGGMGTVYLCKNNRIGNLWAVKEINTKKDHKIDFLAEPNILKHLAHEGIPRIVDIFYEDDNLYIVEDYIEGETLKDYIENRGPVNSEVLIDISLQLCSILEYLHSFNPPIIYRDLKPSNIMIKPNTKIILIDFGIARTYKEGQEGDTLILGSRGYIAPEQLMNIQSNEQTDIYSLGATIYFMATGKAPSLPTELISRGNYPTGLDENLLNIILKSVSIEPKNRYKSAKELVLELKKYKANNDKTFIIERNSSTDQFTKTVFMNQPPKKNKTKSKFLAVALFLLLVAGAISVTFILSNKDKKLSSKDLPKNTQSADTKAEIKKEPAPVQPKPVEETDTVVRGILYKNNPALVNNGADNSKSKGKGKDKDEAKVYQLLFTLNPSASVSNSKYNLSVNSIEVIGGNIIANLNIENKTTNILNLDLNKTYLLNGEGDSVKLYNPSSISLLPIPPNTKKQDIKLYFKEFDFEGNSYRVKTSLNDEKEVNFYIDVK
jgi:serine/threonine protein kinase